MGFERPANDNSKETDELQVLLKRMEAKILENEANQKKFETDNEFSVSVTEKAGYPEHIILKRQGVYSVFFLNKGTDPYLSEIRDVDGQHVDNHKLIQEHRKELADFIEKHYPKNSQIDLPL